MVKSMTYSRQRWPPGCTAAIALEPYRQQESSWDLVFDAQRGDLAAFAEIYRRHYSIVFSSVLGMVLDYSQAEDVTSETFLRALQRIDTVCDQGKDLRVWLLAIAKNIVIDIVRSAQHRREFSVADAIEQQHDALQPDEQLESNLTKETLLSCVQQLGDDHQRCLMLRFYECLSVNETAKLMERNQTAVRALQYRALRKLSDVVPDWLARRA